MGKQGSIAAVGREAVFILMDYMTILGAEGLAYWLRRNIPFGWNGSFYVNDMFFYCIMPVVYLLFLHGLYSDFERMQFWRQTRYLLRSMIYATIVVVVLMYFGGAAGGISRLFMGMAFLFVVLGIIIERYFLQQFFLRHAAWQEPMLFIGAGRTAEVLLKSVLREGHFPYKVVGFLDDHPVSEWITKHYPILGQLDELERVLDETQVQNVMITAPGLEKDRLMHLVNQVQLRVRHLALVPDLIGLPVGNISLGSLFDEKLITLRIQNNLARRHNQIFKRIFDGVLTLVGTICISPFLLLIALLIYFDSPGPVIFVHWRVGKNGKTFPCYKFRTMVNNASEVLARSLAADEDLQQEWQESFKLKNDPRITRLGAFLRRTSLDELPQLFNVLKGEMSLVGPRPIIEAEQARYHEYIHDYYLVLPGITGMWQVSGRSDTTYDERVAMDSWYVRNWSLWLDTILLVRTIKAVCRRDGAY